jgi:hypothetical protein
MIDENRRFALIDPMMSAMAMFQQLRAKPTYRFIYCRGEGWLRRQIPSKSYNPAFSDRLGLFRISSRLSSPQILPV